MQLFETNSEPSIKMKRSVHLSLSLSVGMRVGAGNQFQWRWHRCQIRETTEEGTRNRPRDEIGAKRGYRPAAGGTLACNHTLSLSPELLPATVASVSYWEKSWRVYFCSFKSWNWNRNLSFFFYLVWNWQRCGQDFRRETSVRDAAEFLAPVYLVVFRDK